MINFGICIIVSNHRHIHDMPRGGKHLEILFMFIMDFEIMVVIGTCLSVELAVKCVNEETHMLLSLKLAF